MSEREKEDAIVASPGSGDTSSDQGRSDREARIPPTRSGLAEGESSAGLSDRRSDTASPTAGSRRLDADVYGLRVGVHMSVRYHDRMRAWFMGWHNATMVTTVFSAGGVAARVESLWDFDQLGVVLSILTGASVALNLAFRFSGRAATHHVLANRFRALQGRLVSLSVTRKRYEELVRERLAIESDEPPAPKRLLSQLCQWEVLGATRRDLRYVVAEEMSKVRWWRRLLAPAWSQATFVTKTLRAIQSTTG